MGYNFYYFNAIQFIFLIFYLIYYGRIKPLLELFQSFLTGFLGGFLILLLAPWIVYYFDFETKFFDVAFKAAMVEKGISFFLIFTLVHSFNRKGELNKIIMAGIQYAAGFAFLENVIYLIRFEPHLTYLRLISSVPMHLSTCGIQSYFIGMGVFYSLWRFKIYNFFLALLIPILLHAVYDFLTLQSVELYLYSIGPAIVISVFIFEILYSKAQSFPTRKELKKDRLRLEDWKTLQTQKGHAKWILYSSGTKNLPRISFFRFQKDYVKIIISLVMILQVAIYVYFPDLFELYFKVPGEYRYTLFFIMPLSFSIMFFILGSVDPEYFKNKKIRIPVVLDVDILLPDRTIMTAICYELKPYSTFLHSEEDLKEGETVLLIFRYKSDTSYPIQARILKHIPNNHNEYPSGIVVALNRSSKQFNYFYYKYLLFSSIKGLIFLLNLPGSKAIRALFVRPLTVMQNERFYKKGDIIFRQGDRGKHFYLIKKGRVGLYKELPNNKREKLTEVEPGEIFGEMAIVSDNSRSATAECLEDTIVAVAHKDHLEALVQANPEFVMGLIQNLVKIIQKTEKEIEKYKKNQ